MTRSRNARDQAFPDVGDEGMFDGPSSSKRSRRLALALSAVGRVPPVRFPSASIIHMGQRTWATAGSAKYGMTFCIAVGRRASSASKNRTIGPPLERKPAFIAEAWPPFVL